MALMHEGSGTFEISDHAAGSRGSIRVHFHVPKTVDPEKSLLFAMHGMTREADECRDRFVEDSEKAGRAVVVPEFDRDAFPDHFSYNFGNVIDGATGNLREKHLRSFGIIERIFAHILVEHRSFHEKFSMYGNSAGAQFARRYAALRVSPRLEKTVASNSGAYMLPDIAVSYPTGMGWLGLAADDLKKYFQIPLHLLIGEADTDETVADLPRWTEAMAQGPHRLARGHWYFDQCTSIAREMGVRLNWALETVPGGWSHQSGSLRPCYDRCGLMSAMGQNLPVRSSLSYACPPFWPPRPPPA